MDLKELEKFFKICRKQGVTDITFGEVTVKFGDLPIKVHGQVEDEDIQTPDAPSQDDIIYWAVQNAGQQ